MVTDTRIANWIAALGTANCHAGDYAAACYAAYKQAWPAEAELPPRPDGLHVAMAACILHTFEQIDITFQGTLT